MSKTTEERMVKECTDLLRAELGLTPAPGGGICHKPTFEGAFLCRELDDIRGQLARALGQLGMLGLPDVDADEHGAHRHRKVFSRMPQPSTLPRSRKWICAECLEDGVDTESLPKGPTYEELVAKKRERGGV